MKKLATTSGMALAFVMLINTAQAADFEAQVQQLVVSGEVEKWSGVSFIGDFDTDGGGSTPEDDTHWMFGGDARLSFPLGQNISIQQDVTVEVNSESLFREDGSTDGVDDYHDHSWQATTHLSFMRDPTWGLVGVFGGFGGGKSDGDPNGAWFAGGEFQIYSGEWTFQGQVGYFDSKEIDVSTNESFQDAIFGRGVVRYYFDPNTRLQVEGAYADGVADGDRDDHFLVEWGARFDTMLAGLPVVGDTDVFVRYRGNYVENTDSDGGREWYDDHTVMVGANIGFGGMSRQDRERVGVALDAPNIVRWSLTGEVMD